MGATYLHKTRTGIRCEVFGCRNMAVHYIGHEVHHHTGYHLCDECMNDVYESYAAVKGDVAVAMKQKQIEFEQRQMEAKQKKLYWNARSKKARLLLVAHQLGIDTENGSADDGHMTRVEIMAELRRLIPECEKTVIPAEE